MVDRLVNSEANARRIATVENCFGVSGQPLAIQGRVLVGEGVLTKMCRKKAKPRQFFLFNDILVYGNIVMDKKKYNKQHIIPLEEVKLENLDDDGILKNGWLIRTPTKSFAVYAATATEKTEWMAHINKCVDDLLKKTGKKPSQENAAVWIPDAEASVCMHCRKTQFTVLNRRHHCRKCGAVVCNPCSSKKFLLPSQSSKPLRVCLSCYDTLTNARTSAFDDAGAANKRPETMPSANLDSSGEDDSEDDLDDGRRDGLSDGVGNLSLDDKPMFYGDTSADNQTVECSPDASSNKDSAPACPVVNSSYSAKVDSSCSATADSSCSATTGSSHSATADSSYSATTDSSQSAMADTSTADSSCSAAADSSSATCD